MAILFWIYTAWMTEICPIKYWILCDIAHINTLTTVIQHVMQL